MEESNQPPESAPESTELSRRERSYRRSRERRKRRVPPAAVKRNYLLYLLFYDKAFRWFAVAAIILFGGMGVMWPRIFRTSPDGFNPVIRVSGVDLLKARSLRKTAVAEDAAGRKEEAIQAWIAALASNQADPTLSRGLLTTLSSQKSPDLAWLRQVNSASDWLLRLTGSNHTDLEIAARANAAYGQWDWIIQRLGSTNAPRTEVTTPILLAALFEQGAMNRFAEEWAAHHEQAKNNAQAVLYQAAWTAGWGPAGEYRAAMDQLEAAAQVPATQELGLRLLMRVAFQQVNLASYEQHFSRLRALQADRLRHHVRYWRLLQLSGRKAQAIEAAANFSELPKTVEEAELYVGILADLNLSKPIIEFAHNQLAKADQFAASPRLWVRTSEAVARVGEWDELRVVAAELRQHDLLNVTLGAYSWFLEGWAEHELGRRARAETAFDEFIKRPAADPALTFNAAVIMSRRGYPEEATRLLRQLESSVGNAPELWSQLQRSAYESRQVEVLIEASKRLYQLRPNDAQVANNYAAALLLAGGNKGEAVQVTLEVLNRLPESVPARINRAQALIQAGRSEEAGPLLGGLNLSQLDPSSRTALSFTRFLYHQALGQKAEALQAAGEVEAKFLFPVQLEQLNEAVAKLRAGG